MRKICHYKPYQFDSPVTSPPEMEQGSSHGMKEKSARRLQLLQESHQGALIRGA